LFTGDGGVPLVRYRILDRGGVIPHAAMLAFLRDHGLDPLPLVGKRPARDMPFVFVFGRTGFAVSYYGANVYPENVALGLEERAIAAHVTGKFVLELEADEDHNAALRVSVELLPGTEPSSELEQAIIRSIRGELERQNSEYGSYVPEARRSPRVVLMPAGEPGYFPRGVKHRYTR
jgi:phenylacetate-CoA ligase